MERCAEYELEVAANGEITKQQKAQNELVTVSSPDSQLSPHGVKYVFAMRKRTAKCTEAHLWTEGWHTYSKCYPPPSAHFNVGLGHAFWPELSSLCNPNLQILQAAWIWNFVFDRRSSACRTAV